MPRRGQLRSDLRAVYLRRGLERSRGAPLRRALGPDGRGSGIGARWRCRRTGCRTRTCNRCSRSRTAAIRPRPRRCIMAAPACRRRTPWRVGRRRYTGALDSREREPSLAGRELAGGEDPDPPLARSGQQRGTAQLGADNDQSPRCRRAWRTTHRTARRR